MTVYRMPSGEPFCMEIRPGSIVQVDWMYPHGPVTIAFFDGRWCPSYPAMTVILPQDVARQVLIQSARLMATSGQE